MLFACVAEVEGSLAVVVFIYWYQASPSVAVGWQKDVFLPRNIGTFYLLQITGSKNEITGERSVDNAMQCQPAGLTRCS